MAFPPYADVIGRVRTRQGDDEVAACGLRLRTQPSRFPPQDMLQRDMSLL